MHLQSPVRLSDEIISEMPHMKKNIAQFPQLTPDAKKLWLAIPGEIRRQLLSNVYCGHCGGVTSMVNYSGSVTSGVVVLVGHCITCDAEVARVVD
jgi:hypothetical protein